MPVAELKKPFEGNYVFQHQTLHRKKTGIITDTVIVNPNINSPLLAMVVTQYTDQQPDQNWTLMHLLPRNQHHADLIQALTLKKIESRGMATIDSGKPAQVWLNKGIARGVYRNTKPIEPGEHFLEFNLLGVMAEHGIPLEDQFRRLKDADILTGNTTIDSRMLDTVKKAASTAIEENVLLELDQALAAQAKVKTFPASERWRLN